MSSRRKKNERRGAFETMSDEPSSLQESSDELFHPGDEEMARASELSTGRISGKPLPIVDIRADITQPRRIVPKEIRGVFDGFGENVPALLDAWHDAVMDEVEEMPIIEILNGRAAAFDYAHGSPVVVEFVKLLDLAAQIHDTGLQQPIGTAKLPRNKFEIIFGERRWFAFHVLTHFGIDGYQNIPAKVASSDNPFDIAKIQAAENMQRSELNAIAMARQFAKLIIRARQDRQDPPYDTWKALVVPGGCDRPYFAQVADGYKHQIPTGMGPIFEQTLGISTDQMRKYRALLSLTDDYEVNNRLWDLADEGDWAEGFMRDIAQNLDLDAIHMILKEADDPEDIFREAIAAVKASKPKQRIVTTVTNPDEEEQALTPDPSPSGRGEQDKSGWASAYWAQRWAYASSALVWVIDAPEPNLVTVITGDGNVIDADAVPVTVHVSVMHERDTNEPAFSVDDRVHVAGIGAGVIRYVKDGKYGVYLDTSGSTHYYPAAQLSALTPSPSPSGRGEQDSDNADTPNGDGLVPENWIGKAVKSPVNGEIGLVTTDDGDYVRVKWARGYYSNHQKDALTVVSYQLWIDSVKPKDWTGLYVQTVVGAVAGVVKDNGADVDLIFPDKHQVSQQKQYLTLIDKREWDEAVERHKNALTQSPPLTPPQSIREGNSTGLEKSAYHGLNAAQLVTKRVVYQGKPAIVVGNHGSEDVMLALGDGGRVRVHVSQVALADGSNGQRVVEALTPTPLPQGEGLDEAQVGMLLEEFGKDYNLISAVQMCAQEVGNHEAVEALEQLLGIVADVNSGQLGLLLDECFAHTKEVMAAMEQRVGQRFDAILKGVSHGTD